MNSAASFAIVVLAAVVTIDTARAQQPVTDNVAIDSLIAKLQGAWRPSDVNINGQPSRTSTYGDSRFAGNTWTLQTTNGDHVYELSAINAKADPIEITFTEKDPKRSFIGLLSLDGDTLTITRGMQFTKGKDGIAQIPRPESLDPGRDRIVYTWKRVADSPDISKRPTLTVRLFDDGAVKKEIANHTIRSLFGGKLEYSAGADAAKKLATTSTALGRRVENPILVGTQITGSIEDTDDGQKRVSIEIRLGNAVSTDEPNTAIVRSETLILQTMLKPGEKKRINCGGDRWCELVVE